MKNSVGQSASFMQTEISQLTLDGLPWRFVHLLTCMVLTEMCQQLLNGLGFDLLPTGYIPVLFMISLTFNQAPSSGQFNLLFCVNADYQMLTC